MANTTFANLKIGALRRVGNFYNASDATLLSLTGSIINDVLGQIQSVIKGHPFTLDIGNTVSTVAAQAYVNLVDTDIIEVLQVYERTTNRKLRQITYAEYISMAPDPTRFSGQVDLAWAPVEVLTAGVPTWTLYLIPTASSVQTLYYDYLKSILLTSDSDYCVMPPTYDQWIYEEFKPLFWSVIDPKNTALISQTKQAAMQARSFYVTALMSQADRYTQVGSARDMLDYRYNRVATTPIP